MLGRLARSAVLRASGTSIGKRAVQAAIRAEPSLAIEPLGQRLNRPAGFQNVPAWPGRLEGFEDLAFLFSSSPLNMGIVLLTLDEAAYLYRLVRSLGPATIVEIGRFKGGSTFLIAAAMHAEARLYSYDLHVKLTHEFRGAELYSALQSALGKYRLADRVHVLVAD